MSAAAEWARRGTRLLAGGAFEEAQACFAHAVEIEPRGGTHWALLGKCQAMRFGYHAARDTLAHACSLAPQAAFAHVWLAHAEREQNRPEAAIAACERAAALDPGDVTAALGAALMTPVIYGNERDVEHWRERYAAGLDRLLGGHARMDACARSVFRLEWSNFHLAYQGRNDRDLQIAYSRLIAELLARVVPEWQRPLPRSPAPSPPIRVAFVSANLSRHTVTDYFSCWITDLPRDRFEVAAFHAGTSSDERTRALRAGADHFAHIPSDARRLALSLRERAPDVIIYPDVGMSPLDALLSNLRLAPTQLAGWGHPVTTGSRYIDAYLSCADMEPADAALHYAEELVLLPGIGVDYAPAHAPAAVDRAAFKLAAESHLYVCPQSLFKIHPGTDRLFLDILEQDEAAVLLFFAAPAKGQTDAFVERMTRGMRARGIAMRSQVKLLPHLPRETFLGLLGACDVMLDPLHWSGGNTALDALSVGLPIVTLPGSEMRGRQSAAMLRIVGAEELVATDPAGYVASALRVGCDPRYRASMSAIIRDGSRKLFHRREPVAALADAIERCHRRNVSWHA